MSLVNEALRKARQEAAELQAEERTAGKRDPNASYRPPRAHLPEPSKLGVGLVVGVLLGVLAAGGGGLAVWLAMDRDASTPVAETDQIPAATPPPAASTNPAPPAANTPPTTAAPQRAVEETPHRPAAPQPVPMQSAPVPEPRVEPASQPAQSAPASSPAVAEPLPIEDTVADVTEPTPQPPLIEGRIDDSPAQQSEEDLPKLIEPPESVGQVGDTNIFVLEADLGDTTLTLDFIVWNPAAPFAQINGKQVEVGQLVSGFLVEQIERDQVTLKAANGRIVLRVR